MKVWLQERRRRWKYRKARRNVVAWLDGADAAIAAGAGHLGVDLPWNGFPRDVAAKDPMLAIDHTLAMLRAIESGLDGGDMLAVWEEHRPSGPLPPGVLR